MERITGPTVSPNENGTGRDGFTEGGGATPPTHLNASFFNNVQEELARAVERSGQALDGADFEQLAQAIERAEPAEQGRVSGLGVTDGTGLSVDISAGAFIWNGRRFWYPGGSVAVPPSSTTYIFAGATSEEPTIVTSADSEEVSGVRLAAVFTNGTDVLGVDSTVREGVLVGNPSDTQGLRLHPTTYRRPDGSEARGPKVFETVITREISNFVGTQYDDIVLVPNDSAGTVVIETCAYRTDDPSATAWHQTLRTGYRNNGGAVSFDGSPPSAATLNWGSTSPETTVDASGTTLRVGSELTAGGEDWLFVHNIRIVSSSLA